MNGTQVIYATLIKETGLKIWYWHSLSEPVQKENAQKGQNPSGREWQLWRCLFSSGREGGVTSVKRGSKPVLILVSTEHFLKGRKKSMYVKNLSKNWKTSKKNLEKSFKEIGKN